MRKFKFLALAFAAFSFAACSDDAIEGQSGNGGSAGEGTPAYLTVSFSANAESSSRASNDSNTGDNDGTVEDSEHGNTGTQSENAVKTALIVVVPADATSGGTGYAQLYTVSSTMNDTENTNANLTVDGGENNKYYTTEGPLPIAASEQGIQYEVLVVVNPAKTLTSGDFANVGTGIDDLGVVRNLYNTIISGNYFYQSNGTPNTEDNYVNAAAQLGNATSGFMMANREQALITVYSTNNEQNPAKFDEPIDVERVLSKITFRPASITEEKPSYVYKVESSLGIKYKTLVVEGAYDPKELEEGTEESETVTYSKGNFNAAEDLIGQEVYVLFSEEKDGSKTYLGVFRKTEETNNQDGIAKDLPIFVKMTAKTQTEYDADTEEDKTNWFVVGDAVDETAGSISEEDILGSIEYVIDPNSATEEKTPFYVKLEGYALVNLSKKVNYVRHTTTEPDAAMANPFGSLANNTTYLWTPYWAEKNDVTFDANGEFENNPAVGTWFYNTLKDVSDESKELTVSASGSVQFKTKTDRCFRAMPDSDTDGHNTDTDAGNHSTGDNTSIATPSVGYLLDYCFENSVVSTQQRHGLTTGISFVATIWKNEACDEALETLYRYANNLFTSIKEINDAYAGTIPAIAALAAKEVGGDPITKEELEKAKIERYESNICYYYTTEIKHFDDGGDQTMGVMEFAIMRNNIYSLAISKINEIGEPFVDPTPGTEDETSQAYMSVQAKIVPWIVRYNDIEF